MGFLDKFRRGPPAESAPEVPSEVKEPASVTEDEEEKTQILKVAQFAFGGMVSAGQDVMLGDCTGASKGILQPCEWTVEPAPKKGQRKFLIWF